MPCYRTTAGGMPAMICGKLGPHCSVAGCGGVSGFQCDFPVGERSATCDARLCDRHAHQVGHDTHYCPAHAHEAERARFRHQPYRQDELPL